MEAQHAIRGEDRISKPYIVFRRTVNQGIREHRSTTKDGKEHVTQLGEHQQEWKCVLADKAGELHPWATVLGIQHYISKGYVPIGLGGFEDYLARKDPNQDLVKELAAVHMMLQRSVSEFTELEALRTEVAELRSALALALKGSNDPALQEKLAEVEAKAAGEREEMEARMVKLNEDMLAQSKELEAARESAKRRKGADKQADGE